MDPNEDSQFFWEPQSVSFKTLIMQNELQKSRGGGRWYMKKEKKGALGLAGDPVG